MLALTLLLLLPGVACVRQAAPPKVPTVTAPIYVGEIAVVNKEAKFVLIDLSPTTAPPDAGTPLTAIAPTGETVRLKVTAERKRPFVTADIISGAPARGLRVYR